MCFKIHPRVSEDHPDRSWMLQMGSLSPLSTTCTSRLLSFWKDGDTELARRAPSWA